MSDIRKRMNSLAGKIAVVSGAGGGMGLAIAQAFADLEASVVAIDISPERVQSAQSSIADSGGTVMAIVADVTDAEDVASIVAHVEDRFGHINILVNNVGATLGMLNSFEESSEEDWERLYRINLWHMFGLTHKALPLLKGGGPGGSVINVSTIEAFRGFPFGTAYSAFKAGVSGFTRSLALELAPDGIRVNEIAPETTNSWSNRYERWLPEDEWNQIANWMPLGRFGEPEDAAGCAVFLATEMSAWITGTTLHLDGGCLAAAGWLRASERRWTHRPTIVGTRWPVPPEQRGDVY